MSATPIAFVVLAALIGASVGWLVRATHERKLQEQQAVNIAALEERLRGENDAKLSATREVEAARVERSTLATQLSEHVAREAESRADLASLRASSSAQMEMLREQVTLTSAALVTERTNLQKAQEESANLDARLHALAEKVSGGEAREADLQQRLGEAQRRASELESSFESARSAAVAEGKRLGEQLATLAARVAAAETELAQQRQSSMALLNERDQRLSELVAEQAAAAEARRESERELGVAREKVSTLETELRKDREAHEERLKTYREAEERLKAVFQDVAGNVLDASNQRFLTLASSSIDGIHEKATTDYEKRQKAIADMVEPFSRALGQLDQAVRTSNNDRVASTATLMERLAQVDLTSRELRQETGKLVSALKKSGVRGRWGEVQLRRVLEMAGLTPHVDFFEQQTYSDDDGKGRPDAVLHLPGGRCIVIDAKAPLESYLQALDESDEGQRQKLFEQHAGSVRSHVKSLSARGYAERVKPSPEFVVMFLPGDAFLGSAFDVDADLLSFAYEKRVIPVSPTTLLALLLVMQRGWREDEMANSAREIVELGHQLYDRLSNVAERVAHIGKHINQSVNAYNEAVGSLETRLLPAARKLRRYRVEEKPLPELKQVESHPRLLTAPELDLAISSLDVEEAEPVGDDGD